MALSLQLLPAYQAKTLRTNGQSYFVDQRGQRLPSVSSILNQTKPPEAREALMRWRDRLGADEANRVASTASRRGVQLHKHVRHFLLEQAIACSEAAQPYWTSLEPVLQRIETVRLVEGFVYHDDLAYAGRVDCVVQLDGVPCIVDWKTADRPKESVERLYDGPLQLAAYCGAVNHTYAAEDLHIRHAALIVAVPNHPAEVFWFDPETLVQYWQAWQARVAEYDRFRR
jgi:ATP-dependent exoDNAse (exonuclease V) beta subunit